MIFLQAASEPFTPPWYKDNGPVFMVRAGNVAERERFEAEMSGEHDAGRVWDFQINAAFEEGMAFLLGDAPDQLAELQALLAAEKEVHEHNAALFVSCMGLPAEEREAFLAKEKRELAPVDRQGLEEIRRLMREHWPDYRALLAQQERRMAMMPLVAFRRFCTGWEGLDTPCEIGPDRMVTLKAMAGVSQNDMKAVGHHAYGLLYAVNEETTRKNSNAPSKSASAPTTSRSGAGSSRAGRSRASGGRKTPR